LKERSAFNSAIFAAALLPAATVAILSDGGPVAVLASAALFYALSVCIIFLVGGPIFLALRKLSMFSWWSATIAGFLCGAGVMGLLDGIGLTMQVEVHPLLLWGVTGALSGLVFWATWRKLRTNYNVEA
jgi:hypothetical protein